MCYNVRSFSVCFEYILQIHNLTFFPIFEYCKKPPTPRNGGLFDISEGKTFRGNNALMTLQNMIKIVLFQDAFEVCNPICAPQEVFKIVAVYILVINVPPHLRSKTENIQLVILCFDKYGTKFGWKQVLQKLVQDFEELETLEITFSIEGNYTTFLGILLVMLGDNLGSHQIGGYTENFSKSNNFCRYCEVS